MTRVCVTVLVADTPPLVVLVVPLDITVIVIRSRIKSMAPIKVRMAPMQQNAKAKCNPYS